MRYVSERIIINTLYCLKIKSEFVLDAFLRFIPKLIPPFSELIENET